MIEEMFNKIKRDNQDWSDIICFNVMMIRAKRKFGRPTISKTLKRLVDKEDYRGTDIEKIIDQASGLNVGQQGFCPQKKT